MAQYGRYDESWRIECLVREIVDMHNGDVYAIKEFFERIEKQDRLIAKIPGLRDLVRNEVRRRRRGKVIEK